MKMKNSEITTNKSANSSSRSEMKIYGLHAAQAVWLHRPSDIVRVYLTEEHLRNFAPLLKWCAKEKKAYHILDHEALAKVAASVHHEGICLLAKEPRRLEDAEFLQTIRQTVKTSTSKAPAVSDLDSLLYLDGVQNPHNIGSILRVGAHFGLRYLLGAATQLPRISPSAVRVAEGGFEHVSLVGLHSPAATLQALRDLGYSVISTSSHASESLYTCQLPQRVVIILGSEVHGVSQKIAALSDKNLCIPGSGKVESLNVSVACGLLLSEHYRVRAAT